MTVALIVIAMVVGIGACLFALGSRQRGFQGCCILAAVLALGFAGYLFGQKESALPGIEGLCRGQIEFSWEVKDSQMNEIEDALKGQAKCDVTFTQTATPPAFPRK